MDRRLLYFLILIAIFVLGCSREKSPPPTMARAAPSPAAPVKAEMRPLEVASPDAKQSEPHLGMGGIGISGSGSGSAGASASRVSSNATDNDLFAASNSPTEPSPAAAAATSMPADHDATFTAQQRQLTERARAEESRRRALEEATASASLGVLGAGGAQSNNATSPFAPSTTHDQNPLRIDAPPRLAPHPSSDNPLRQPREPRIPSAPTAAPAFPVPLTVEPPVPSSSFAANNPSGGSTPPGTTPLGGGSPLEPRETKAGSADKALIGGGAAPPSNQPPSNQPLAFKPVPAPATVEDESQCDVVEVLYGTDRLAGQQKASDLGHLLLQFAPTVIVSVLAIGLIVIGIRHRNWLLGTVATAGFAACLLLGYDAVGEVLSRIRGANHQGPRYTTDRSHDGRIEVGRCEVTIPRTHIVGEVETPSILRLEVAADVCRHLVLQKTERLANPKYYDLLRHRVGQSSPRELFVFVHGFNVSFEDAALRTAQISHDLKFDGAPIFFSWPANDRFIFTYPADETNVAWSVPHLKKFLLEIVKESQAQSINLIAHSMGNRALAAALREIELEMHDQARLFNQVILAAPDIDADDFRNNIAPAMQRTARGLTLYASSHDEALLASQIIHRRPRAGDAGEGLTVVAGIDTIDVTAIDQSFFGHSYYGSSHPVLNDLKALLTGAVPPRDRTWLSPAERDGLTYWIFQPETRTASGDSGLTR